MKFLKKVETASEAVKKTYGVLYSINGGGVMIKEANTILEGFVDLDLPSGTLWAKCNIGAISEEETGLYFQWGDTVGRTADEIADKPCNWLTVPYQTNTGATNLNYPNNTKWEKYLGSTTSTYKTSSATDENALKTILDLSDDAAYITTNGIQRLPTVEELQELCDNTTNEWVNINGVNGKKLVSKKDSTKYIFLPAFGSCSDISIPYVNNSGGIWANSIEDTTKPYNANQMGFSSTNLNPKGHSYRYVGRTIRGVLCS